MYNFVVSIELIINFMRCECAAHIRETKQKTGDFFGFEAKKIYKQNRRTYTVFSIWMENVINLV